MVHTTWYDNSAANPAIRTQIAPYPGAAKLDEMLYGAFSYTLVDETSEAPILDKTLADTTQMVGFLDKDMDGKLSWQELPGTYKEAPQYKALRWSIATPMAALISHFTA